MISSSKFLDQLRIRNAATLYKTASSKTKPETVTTKYDHILCIGKSQILLLEPVNILRTIHTSAGRGLETATNNYSRHIIVQMKYFITPDH